MESMQQWYLDSDCSKHMTRDKSKFVSITFKQEGHVTYGDNNCTALVVGSDDVAPSYSVGVLTRRQVGRRGGSQGAREVAIY